MAKTAEKVRTAIVGCGMISNIYIKNLKNLFSIIDLVAISDINRAAAEEKARTYGISRVLTPEEVAASPDIEMVINLTPAYVHYRVIRQMLEAGKHVWTEKVMAVTCREAKELCDLASEKGLYLGCAPDTVLGAGLQTARRALDTGMIGTVTSGVAVINRDQTLNSEVFTFLRGNGGTLPYDVGIYYIGALLSLLGPVKSVKAFGAPAPVHAPQFLFRNGGEEPWQIPGSNVLSASLLFRSGALVSVLFDGNTVNASQHILTLFGTMGVLKVGDPNTFGGENTLLLADQKECPLPFTHGYDGKNTLDPSPYDHYGHRGIGAAEMAYAIRQGRPNRLNGAYGLHCLEVLEAMERSASGGETVNCHTVFSIKPLRPGYYSSFLGGSSRADAECSLMDL